MNTSWWHPGAMVIFSFTFMIQFCFPLIYLYLWMRALSTRPFKMHSAFEVVCCNQALSASMWEFCVYPSLHLAQGGFVFLIPFIQIQTQHTSPHNNSRHKQNKTSKQKCITCLILLQCISAGRPNWNNRKLKKKKKTHFRFITNFSFPSLE